LTPLLAAFAAVINLLTNIDDRLGALGLGIADEQPGNGFAARRRQANAGARALPIF
jgi:hypothetical protein